MREEISKILVKWSMPTRQVAISELLSLFQSEMRKNVGQLRQWLNEDRITDPKKMVTNEEIETFLEGESR